MDKEAFLVDWEERIRMPKLNAVISAQAKTLHYVGTPLKYGPLS